MNNINISKRSLREAVRGAAEVANVLVTLKPVGNAIGAAKYILKDIRDPRKQPELPPKGFRRRLIRTSRGFLTAPLKELWKQVQLARKGSTSVPRGGLEL